MAMAPEIQRIMMIGACLEGAKWLLGSLIDKVVVEENGRVTVWAGRQRVSTRPQYRPSDRLGGGSWEVQFGPVETEPDPDE
jgi:hypothetical protein